MAGGCGRSDQSPTEESLTKPSSGAPQSAQTTGTEPRPTPGADEGPAAPGAPDAPPAPRVARLAGDLAPFVQVLPGTTVELELVPVAMPAAGGDATLLWVARTETTWDAYDVLVFGLDVPEGGDPALDATVRPSKPYVLADYGFGHQGWPAISVSANGALAFCDWLSARTGRRWRLPTEAEHEALCLAGSGAWCCGQDERALEAHAWVKDNAGFKTHAVGTREPDALGLLDLLGNAGEWCVAEDGATVLRGGAYVDKAEQVRCDARKPPVPAWNARDPQLPKSRWWLTDAAFAGFRVVCEDPGAPDR